MTQRKGPRNIPERKVFQGYSKIRGLVEKPETDPKVMIKHAFERGGKLLTDEKVKCRVSFRTRQLGQIEYFSYEVAEKGGIYSEEPLEKPDVEIFVNKDTFLEILQGNLSPIEAIGKRRMRVRGNIKLALKLYKTLAEPEGEIAPCREEVES